EEEAMSGYLYFIQSGDAEGPVKIGFATDPVRRFHNIQASSPNPVRLLATIPGDSSAGKDLHRRFADLRGRGEWFRWAGGLRECVASLPTTIPRLRDSGFNDFNIRMPSDLVAALDEGVATELQAHPGRALTRSDLIREALYEYVAKRRGARGREMP